MRGMPQKPSRLPPHHNIDLQYTLGRKRCSLVVRQHILHHPDLVLQKPGRVQGNAPAIRMNVRLAQLKTGHPELSGRPTLGGDLPVRLVLGAIAALVFLVLLQSINNAVFDPVFEPKPAKTYESRLD
jgi:hypothetical protein